MKETNGLTLTLDTCEPHPNVVGVQYVMASADSEGEIREGKSALGRLQKKKKNKKKEQKQNRRRTRPNPIN